MTQVASVTTYDVSVARTGGDAGDIFEFQCPVCRDAVQWARFKWWDVVCKCGYEWEVEVQAIGKKP